MNQLETATFLPRHWLWFRSNPKFQSVYPIHKVSYRANINSITLSPPNTRSPGRLVATGAHLGRRGLQAYDRQSASPWPCPAPAAAARQTVAQDHGAADRQRAAARRGLARGRYRRHAEAADFGSRATAATAAGHQHQEEVEERLG